MHAFARILFHVQASNSDALGSLRSGDINPTMLTQRFVELRNLVTLGKVGIEIVFSREDRGLVHLAIERHSSQRGELHRTAVQNRQRPRKPKTYWADLGVGSGAETG